MKFNLGRSFGVRRFSSLVCLGWLAASGAASGAGYEWDFSGNLNPILGDGLLEFADPDSESQSLFKTTGGGVPHINGQAATFLHVPAFSALGSGYNLSLTGTGPNGGGAYVNQYTFIFDVLSPGSINWAPFFNTDPGNGNDADFYIADNGALGIGDVGYSAAGTIAADTWYRIAYSADLAAGTISYYVNGSQVFTGSGALDGRFSLYSNVDAGPDVRLFNEGDGSGQYTHELYLSSFYATDSALSAAQIASFGGPNAFGIVAVPEPGAWALLAMGAAGLLTLRRARKPVKESKVVES